MYRGAVGKLSPTAPADAIHVKLPESSHTTSLAIPALPPAACIAHIFPALTSGSLLSIGLLRDHGCEATFAARRVTITLRGTPILSGIRDHSTHGLWTINLTLEASNAPLTDQVNRPRPSAHLALSGRCTVAERVAFYHAAMFSPVISTWCAALEAGHCTTWPGLTAKQVRQHAPHSVATVKGHLDQQRRNLQSTKVTDRPLSDKLALSAKDGETSPTLNDTAPDALQADEPRSHQLFAACHEATGQIYTDPTGRFVTPSTSGNEYLLILYDYDSNYVHAEPMRNRKGPEIIAAYKRSLLILTKAGLRPRLQRLDNEASAALQAHMDESDIDYQLAPPNVHRRNAAERAIRTFKNHFIAGLCSTDTHFPLTLWDTLILQALITLNLLRRSRINPRLSAQAQVHGAFDYNRTPFAPPGCKVLVHEKPAVRGTWAPHAVDGWYLGPAMKHYRCYRVWIWDTESTRIADTLEWFPQHVVMPTLSSADAATAAAQALLHALLHPEPASTLSPISDNARTHLTDLARIFQSVVPPTPPPTSARPSALPKPADAAPLPRVPNLPRVTFRSPLVDTPALTTTLSVPPTPATNPPTPAPKPVAAPFPAHTTYAQFTRNPNQRRRQRAKAAKAAKNTIPAIRRARRQSAPPSHPHNTRFRPSTSTAGKLNAAQLSPPPPIPPLSTGSLPAHAYWHSAHAVIDPAIGASLSYKQLKLGKTGKRWTQGAANEIGRLAQGHKPNIPTGTKTIHFIRPEDLPPGRIATYLKIVCALKPLKAEQERVRFTVGGDRIDYPGKVSTPTADLTTCKMLFNSVISTLTALFMCLDIENFYLNTPMARYEYMRIPTSAIPDVIMQEYDLAPLVHNGHVLVEIRKGMYGLPQAGILANDRLVKHLLVHGYKQAKHTPGLFTHATRPLTFCLTVDDFGVKYTRKEDVDHLIATLRILYTISIDWTGHDYCGLTLDWDYVNRTVDISIPGYVENALHKFQHPERTRAQHAPHAWLAPSYGAVPQLATAEDTSDSLNAADSKRVQEIVGALLFYARAVDPTMLVALGTIASSKRTQDASKAVTQLLNYAATHPDAIIRYHASAMILHVHSDASYLSAPKARSRAGGFFFLSSGYSPSTVAPSPTATPPPVNGSVHTPCTLMRMVLSSATEAELGALFYNAKDAAWLRTTLIDMGHPQPPTPIQTDNVCAAGIANDTVKQRRSKAIDMRFYWIRDRIQQGQFLVHWRKGADNLADYFTKHHSPSHHRLMRPLYLHPAARRTPLSAALLQRLIVKTRVCLYPQP
jgi:hypothetical protein